MKALRFNQQQYAIDYRRMHHTNEQQQYKNFKSALDDQTNRVKEYVKIYGASNIPYSVLITKQPIAEAYKRCYEKVGVNGAMFTERKINGIVKGQKSHDDLEIKKTPSSFFSEYWRKLMSLFYQTDGGDRITKVTETTRDTIMNLIDDSQDLPISQQADYIVNQLDDPEFNRDRALRIARTETTTAANKGAMLAAESSEYETGKMWLAILDANTRPDHVNANGELVAMDETFVVGDSLMMYPGDPAGSAKEVINCRCCIAMVPLVGDNGAVVRKVG